MTPNESIETAIGHERRVSSARGLCFQGKERDCMTVTEERETKERRTKKTTETRRPRVLPEPRPSISSLETVQVSSVLARAARSARMPVGTPTTSMHAQQAGM
jgi:hypothetical protein